MSHLTPKDQSALAGLPAETLKHIICFLWIQDVCAVALTCNPLYEITECFRTGLCCAAGVATPEASLFVSPHPTHTPSTIRASEQHKKQRWMVRLCGCFLTSQVGCAVCMTYGRTPLGPWRTKRPSNTVNGLCLNTRFQTLGSTLRDVPFCFATALGGEGWLGLLSENTSMSSKCKANPFCPPPPPPVPVVGLEINVFNVY